MTVVLPNCETLPVASVDVAWIVSPPCNSSFSGTLAVKLPFSSAVTSTTAPLGNVTFTVEFASAVPVT